MTNDNPMITHVMSLSDHNFIVSTLNRNPLQANVMEVAALINRLNATATAAVESQAAPDAQLQLAPEERSGLTA